MKKLKRFFVWAVPAIAAYIAIRWLLDFVFHGRVETEDLGDDIISGVLFYIVFSLIIIYNERMNKNK